MFSFPMKLLSESWHKDLRETSRVLIDPDIDTPIGPNSCIGTHVCILVDYLAIGVAVCRRDVRIFFAGGFIGSAVETCMVAIVAVRAEPD